MVAWVVGYSYGWDVLRPGGLEPEDCVNFSFGRDGSVGCRMLFGWDVLRPGGLEAEDCIMNSCSFSRDGGVGCRMLLGWVDICGMLGPPCHSTMLSKKAKDDRLWSVL